LLFGQGVCDFVEHPFGISSELFAEPEFDGTVVDIHQKAMFEQYSLNQNISLQEMKSNCGCRPFFNSGVVCNQLHGNNSILH